jgi:hypothetical protein
VFVAGYGAWQLARALRMTRASAWWALPIGLAGGSFSVLFGTGGPIYMDYLSARVRDKTRLRATSSLLVTFSVWTRIAIFVATGLLLDASLWVLAALMIPVMLAGLKLGNRLHHVLSEQGVLRLVGNGVLRVVRALGWFPADAAGGGPLRRLRAAQPSRRLSQRIAGPISGSLA